MSVHHIDSDVANKHMEIQNLRSEIKELNVCINDHTLLPSYRTQ